MVTCAIGTCRNTSGRISKIKNGISFHRFPRDEVRRRKWEIAVNREKEWTSTVSSVVCSEHFETKDFYLTENGLRRLFIEAVPTINISPCQEPAPTICDHLPIDIKPTDSKEIIQLKYKVRRLEMIAANRKKKLNLMRESKRSLSKKLEIMNTHIQHLIRHKQFKQNGNIKKFVQIVFTKKVKHEPK